GATKDELVFVSGHPGRTNRLDTMAELDYQRDIAFPFNLQRLNRVEVLLMAFSGRSEENARQAKELLFAVQNSRKARVGGLAGLLDPAVMARKREYEQKLRDKANDSESLKEARTAWDRIAKAQKVRAAHVHRFTVLENGSGFNNLLFGIAR